MFTVQQGGVAVLVKQGPQAGTLLHVGAEPKVVGSESTNDLVLTDPTVSRRHLQLTARSGLLHLRDLGSKNGSFVGGQRIDELELAAGGEVALGDTVLKVLPQEQVVEPEEAAKNRFGSMVGEASATRQLFSMIERVAPTEASVLIEGETGVGKELVAEEIHQRSARRDGPFMVFDCGAVPDELIESTLFGHVKGSFTGAHSDKEGILSKADGGTVFLDEIGELDLALQPALLRVLDRGMLRPVGAAEYKTVNVRIIAATHRNLGQFILAKQFREDLYYRLAVVRLAVPPLRERLDDIQLLAEYFLSRLGRPDLDVPPAALKLMHGHRWPGNVRELRNVVERTMALSLDGRFSVEAMLAGGGLAPISAEASNMPTPASHVPSSQHGGRRQPFREAKALAIEAFERGYLSDLMAEHRTMTAAAGAASMDRKHLKTLLKRHNISND